MTQKRFLLTHPRSGSTWFRRLLRADPRRTNFELTHDGVFISGRGGVVRPLSKLHKLRKASIICLVRDPRSIAVSLFFFFFCRYRCENTSIKKARFVKSQVELTIEFYERIKQEANARWKRLHIVHYEDLLIRPEEELEAACVYWDFPVGDPVHSVMKHTFDKMRVRDISRTYNRSEFQWKYEGDPKSLQVREGEADGWKKHFSENELPRIPEWLLPQLTS